MTTQTLDLNDRGLFTLVHINRDTWLPELTDDSQRYRAAVAYVAARRSGIDREAARAQAREALSLSDCELDTLIEQHRAAEREKQAAAEAVRAERERTEAARQAEFRRRFAIACDLNRHDLKTVLKAAMKHTECSRWTGDGWKRNGRWSLSVSQTNAHQVLDVLDIESLRELHAASAVRFDFTEAGWMSQSLDYRWAQYGERTRDQVLTAANEDNYQALVSILGRRSWNQGEGRRHDVTAETPNDKNLVGLAKSIIARKKVSPKKLMSIQDTHARAWAVELTGGWGRMTSAMQLVHKTAEGSLYSGEKVGLSSDVLVVKCPSTGQRYALMVPRPNNRAALARAKNRTVANALKAVNGINGAKIVAAS